MWISNSACYFVNKNTFQTFGSIGINEILLTHEYRQSSVLCFSIWILKITSKTERNENWSISLNQTKTCTRKALTSLLNTTPLLYLVRANKCKSLQVHDHFIPLANTDSLVKTKRNNNKQCLPLQCIKLGKEPELRFGCLRTTLLILAKK